MDKLQYSFTCPLCSHDRFTYDFEKKQAMCQCRRIYNGLDCWVKCSCDYNFENDFRGFLLNEVNRRLQRYPLESKKFQDWYLIKLIFLFLDERLKTIELHNNVYGGSVGVKTNE